MQIAARSILVFICLVLFLAPWHLFGQGFVHYPPLDASAAYQITELSDGQLKVHGNHHNYNFNAQATLSSYLLSPQGIYLGIGDSLQNTNTNDYWLWLPNAEHLVTFRTLSASSKLRIERFRPDSTNVYDRTLAFPGADSIYFGNVKEMANGDLFAFGLVDTSSGIFSPDMVCMRINALGDTIWMRKLTIFPGQDIDVEAFQTEIVELADGDIAIVLLADSKPMFVRLQSNGQLVYKKFYGSLQLAANPAAAIAQDGSMFLTFNDATVGALYLLSLDTAAQIVWQKDLRAPFQAEVDVPGTYQVLINGQGNCTFAGSMLIDGIDRQLVFAEFGKVSGNLLKMSTYSGMAEEAPRLLGSLQLANGNLAYCGSYLGRAVVIKLNQDGKLFDGRLAGRVAIDLDNDCLADLIEPPIRNWLVEAKGANTTYYAYTDQLGNYAIDNMDSSEYIIRLKQQNYTWQSCPDSVLVLIAHDTVLSNIAAKSIFDCAVMKLDIAAPFVRYCAPNIWHVDYRNYGSETAKNVRIEIQLDPILTFAQASITPSNIVGQVLTFDLPDVQPSEGGSLWFTGTMDCASTLPGRSLCVRGHIYPDSICAPNLGGWNGGMLEANPACVNDTVKFELINKGKNPTGALDYIIIEDHIFLRTEPVNLNPGEAKIIEQYAANGGTIRIKADQVSAHPLALMPNIAVEGCGPGTLFSTGYLTELPNQSGNPFTDVFCDRIIASLDPNDKRAFPQGYDPQHIIEQNTPIEYIIRFQNTGTDTAFRVVVIDTLSPFLDLTTVRPGSSSHPFTYMPSANSALVFTFDPIALPDSTTNEPESHGFIQFWVNQYPNVQKGSVIENIAHIYFDVNAPVSTNKTIHRIDDIIGFEEIPILEQRNSLLIASPNPMHEHTKITWEGEQLHRPAIQIRDALGILMYEVPMIGKELELNQLVLPSGLYTLSLQDAGYPVATTKLTIVR